jgi:hypothetical protein
VQWDFHLTVIRAPERIALKFQPNFRKEVPVEDMVGLSPDIMD